MWNKNDKNANITIKCGDLLSGASASGAHKSIRSITSHSSGIHYAEILHIIPSYYGFVGIGTSLANINNYPGSDAYGYGWQNAGGGYLYHSGPYGAYPNYASGDVLGILLDLDAGTLTFYKNGVSQGLAFSSVSGTYFLMADNYDIGIYSILNTTGPFYSGLPAGATAWDSPTSELPIYLNSADKHANISLSFKDLIGTLVSESNWRSVRSTVGYSSNKRYMEAVFIAASSNMIIGIATSAADISNYCGSDAYGYGFHNSGGIYNSGSNDGQGSSFVVGDVIGVALDMDNLELHFYKNGSLVLSKTGIAPGEWFIMISVNAINSKFISTFFGPFYSVTPPTGYYAWEKILYYISGTVSEESSYVERTVRAYLRSTGILIGEVTSDSGDGSFSILCETDAEHYVIALDDDLGSEYNALIYDRIIPE